MTDLAAGKCRARRWLTAVVLGCWALALPAWGPKEPPAVVPKSPPMDTPQQWASPEYIRWLEQRSMLYQAGKLAEQVSGKGVQWRHPYGEPEPREVVARAPVWVLGYPGSVITRPGQSVLATWADPELWKVFQEIGIDLLHTGPIKRAGGIERYQYTPTIDGWFDRISLEIDPALGTEAEYRQLVKNARGLVAGDLVPLHTGKGADFRLAQRVYKDYPGMYTMVEIRKEDWPLLPEVKGPWASALVSKERARKLRNKGYIPGLIHPADADPRVRDSSGWSASGEVLGVDGQTRRWVYLHYFKPGQPTLNWLDPSTAGPRAIAGDVVKTIHDLGARVVRLDAVPFLGIEPRPDLALAWNYQHPLSVMGTNYLAFLTRKLGGWSFQELNVPLHDLKKFTEHGPDLSYDFATRTQCVHALLSGDAALYRQSFHFLLEANIQPVTLVHDLQNHDEITYQLVELDYRGDETFTIDGKKVTGRQLREQALREMRAQAAGEAAPYNHLYRPQEDGLATTFAGFIAASLGIRDPYKASAEQKETIKQGHLLLTWANAMQPGVFSLSAWDLVGALPLPTEAVQERLDDKDYRWINRGGVDLLGVNPKAKKSAFGLPRAQTLYGPLPEQLKDEDSFASQLKRMLAARKKYRIAEGQLLAVPEVKNRGVCLLVLKLPGKHPLAITALNFGRERAREQVDLSTLKGIPARMWQGRKVTDSNDQDLGMASESGKLTITLPPLTGRTLILQ
jgi:trehalose synthase